MRESGASGLLDEARSILVELENQSMGRHRVVKPSVVGRQASFDSRRSDSIERGDTRCAALI
jgi:hypothetical protein